MKLEKAFQTFIENEVNLNKSRHDRIKAAIPILTKFLKETEIFKNNVIDIIPQGSYRQKTIIKPVLTNHKYDVDLLLELKEFDDWNPKDYLKQLHQVFSDNQLYEDITEKKGKTRCVTINYSNDFHVDIVPAILRGGKYFIMNKNTNLFEPTDGDGYAEWFSRQNDVTVSDKLIESIRLLKYIRNKKGTFSAKSVILTTLMAQQVLHTDTIVDHYSDLPTSFKTLMQRLAEYVKNNSTLPTIYNPALPSEAFTRNWTQDVYNVFREKVIYYNDKIQAAYSSTNEKESYRIWAEVFGNEFPTYEISDVDKSLPPTGPFVSPKSSTGDMTPRRYG